MKEEIKQLQEKAREEFDKKLENYHINIVGYGCIYSEEKRVIKKYINTLIEQTYKQTQQEERKRIRNRWIASKRKRDGTAQGCLDMVEQFDNFIQTLTK
jgi:histone H3/H4